VGHSRSHPFDFAEVLAFRVRPAAAPVQKEFSFAGWLKSAELIKVDSSGSSSGSDKDMS